MRPSSRTRAPGWARVRPAGWARPQRRVRVSGQASGVVTGRGARGGRGVRGGRPSGSPRPGRGGRGGAGSSAGGSGGGVWPVRGSPQCGDEVRAAGEPAVGLLRGRPRDGGVHRGGQVRPVQAGARGIGREVGVEHPGRLGAGVGHLPGEGAEHQARQAVLVGAPVEPLALDLLRRRVLQRADVLPRRGDLADGRAPALGDAEVAQVHLLATAGPRRPRDQDVARLDVPVHEPGLVHGVERLRHGPEHRAHPLDVERALSVEYGAEILPVDEAHRQVQDPVRVARVVDRHDVRVFEARRDGGLALEPAAVVRVGGQRRRQDLERDGAVQLQMGRPVDHPHPALADERIDAVTGQHVPDPARCGCAPLIRHRQSGSRRRRAPVLLSLRSSVSRGAYDARCRDRVIPPSNGYRSPWGWRSCSPAQ